MNPSPVLFRELPAESFPVLVEFWVRGRDLSGPPTRFVSIDGPGAVRVPGFGPGTHVRVTTGDGTVQRSCPPGPACCWWGRAGE